MWPVCSLPKPTLRPASPSTSSPSKKGLLQRKEELKEEIRAAKRKLEKLEEELQTVEADLADDMEDFDSDE